MSVGMAGSPTEGDEKHAQANILRTESEQRACFSREALGRQSGHEGLPFDFRVAALCCSGCIPADKINTADPATGKPNGIMAVPSDRPLLQPAQPHGQGKGAVGHQQKRLRGPNTQRGCTSDRPDGSPRRRRGRRVWQRACGALHDSRNLKGSHGQECLCHVAQTLLSVFRHLRDHREVPGQLSGELIHWSSQRPLRLCGESKLDSFAPSFQFQDSGRDSGHNIRTLLHFGDLRRIDVVVEL